MPNKPSDYVSPGGKVFFEPLVQNGEWEHSVEMPKFVPGEVGQANNVGQEIPKSALASDQTSFTGEEILFSKNANNFSEDSGLPYNKGDDTGV